MKQATLLIVFFSLIISVLSCKQQDKSKVVAEYKYEEDIPTTKVEKKLESWVEVGVECYSVIMVCDITGYPIRIKEAHVKVAEIQPKKIKMMALENVIINPIAECRKVSLKKGDTWEEEYGDIFKTRGEAIKYIDENYPGLRVKN
jgi:hypothetical protein